MFCNIPNANVAAIADGTAGNADSRTMAYDGLDRLTSTNAPHQWWISATTTYDALDDIRANQVGNTATYLNTFSYDPTTWHLTAIAGHVNWALSYDANGNVISKGAGNDAYAFDAANRMTSVTGKESYRYDGYGRRVKITRSTDGKIDYPVYDLGGQLLTEDDQRSNQTTDYVSLNGSLVAKRASAIGKNQWTTTYEHTDALRSPRLETSASGALTRAELYTPYGEPGDGKYVQGPGYTGHVTDAATHLTYAQQRYYDPVMGRFLSVDPVLPDDKGGSFNRYWYANNNPYRFTDPDGRANVLGIIANFPQGFGTPNASDLHVQAAAQRSVDLTVNAALKNPSVEIQHNIKQWSVTVDPSRNLSPTGGIASTRPDQIATTYYGAIALLNDTQGVVTFTGGMQAPGGDAAMLAVGGHEIGHTTAANMALPSGPLKEADASRTAIEISKTSADVKPGTITQTTKEVEK